MNQPQRHRRRQLDYDRLLTPAEVAVMLNVVPKTVTTWAKNGRLSSVRTIGGHRRFYEAEVLKLVAESKQERTR